MKGVVSLVSGVDNELIAAFAPSKDVVTALADEESASSRGFGAYTCIDAPEVVSEVGKCVLASSGFMLLLTAVCELLF